MRGQVSVNGWHDVEIGNTVHSPARESAEAARNEKFKVHARKIKIHRFDGKWLTRRVSHLRRSHRLQFVSALFTKCEPNLSRLLISLTGRGLVTTPPPVISIPPSSSRCHSQRRLTGM